MNNSSEKFDRTPNIFEPVRALLKRVFTPLASDDTATSEERPEKEARELEMQDFWKKFLNSLMGQENSRKLTEDLKKLELLNAASSLVSLHAKSSRNEVSQFYTDKDIEIQSLPNHELITVRSGEEGSVLEQSFFEAIKRFPYYEGVLGKGALYEYIKNNKFTLKDLVEQVYQLHGCREMPKRRKEMQGIILEVMDAFYEELQKRPELDALLREITRIAAATEKSKSGKDQEKLDEDKKAVEHEFINRASESKIALERLYALKRLNPLRASRFIIRPENASLMQELGVNPRDLLRRFTDQYLDKFDNASYDLQAHIQAQNIPNAPEGRLAFLANEPIGKKICNVLEITFDELQNALEEAVDNTIAQLITVEHGTAVDSFDELVEKIAQDPDINPMGGYSEIAANTEAILAQQKQVNQGKWEFLSTAFEAPENQRGGKETVVNKIYKRLLNNPLYNQVVANFDRFYRIIKNQLRLTRPVKDDTDEVKQDYNDKVKAIKECQKAVGDKKEGFERDFLYTMPIKDKASIQFSTFDEDTDFSFKSVIEKYIEELPGLSLVDIQHEIENDMLRPILVELGIQITDDQDFTPNAPSDYISKEDFDMAKQIGQALTTLEGESFRKAETTEEPEETKPVISEDDLKQAEEKAKGDILSTAIANPTEEEKKEAEDDKDKRF